MVFAFDVASARLLVGITLRATVVSAVGITGLILFIWLRRTLRARHFARRDAIAKEIRANWDSYLGDEEPWKDWTHHPIHRELLESILLDKIEVATRTEFPVLLRCLQRSGLLDLRIKEARSARGWRRQAALIVLGRSHAPEAIPALTEALTAKQQEIVATAVRGLGRIATIEAAAPILDGLVEGRIKVPPVILKNALVSCCRDEPGLILKYIVGASLPVRELLARSLAEIATPWLGDEIALLAADPHPEVRASAARALAEVHPDLAVPLLSLLTGDSAWFVRVRAVNSLAALRDRTAIPALVQMCCDGNRVVRQRAAIALVEFENDLLPILEKIVDTRDQYALQTFISELQRHGVYSRIAEALEASPCEPRNMKVTVAVQSARRNLSPELALLSEPRPEYRV